jgi:hypothetical protein
MSGGSGDGFLSRWSRRKRAAPSEAEPAEESPPQDDTAVALPEDVARDMAEDVADEAYIAALPRIEEIVKGTDIRGFLKRGVPEALRNAALRRAWSADPAIRDYLDVAVDYAWDFNAPGGVPGGGGVLKPERVAEMLRTLSRPAKPASAEPGADRRTRRKRAIPESPSRPSRSRRSRARRKPRLRRRPPARPRRGGGTVGRSRPDCDEPRTITR